MGTDEYRLERMQNYAGTAVTERTYNLTIGLTLLWGVLINVVMATFFTYQILSDLFHRHDRLLNHRPQIKQPRCELCGI